MVVIDNSLLVCVDALRIVLPDKILPRISTLIIIINSIWPIKFFFFQNVFCSTGRRYPNEKLRVQKKKKCPVDALSVLGNDGGFSSVH